jgi:hypothetical protein
MTFVKRKEEYFHQSNMDSREAARQHFIHHYVFGISKGLQSLERNSKDQYLFSGGIQIISYHEKTFPVSFSFIGEDCVIMNCTELNTLKGFLHDLRGKFLVKTCDKLDVREIEIMNDNRLRKLWNESTLNLDDFLLEQRGNLSSKKFGF